MLQILTSFEFWCGVFLGVFVSILICKFYSDKQKHQYLMFKIKLDLINELTDLIDANLIITNMCQFNQSLSQLKSICKYEKILILIEDSLKQGKINTVRNKLNDFKKDLLKGSVY